MSDALPQVSGSVLVGIDGSEPAMTAARWAADWATARSERLTVLRVVPWMPLPSRTGALKAMREGVDFEARLHRIAHHQLQEALAALREVYPDLPIEGSVLTAHPAEALAQLAEYASMTVLGATGESGLSGALLGGTVAAVLHEARGPVVVVPKRGGAADGPVIVGLDGGEASARIARVAIEAAKALDRPLVAVYAWELDAMSPTTAYGALSLLIKDEREIDAEGVALLTELTGPAADAGLDVDLIVRWGRPRVVLCDLADTAALMVVGSRGHGGFPGLVLGSVSRALTQRPRCPTLVVRP